MPESALLPETIHQESPAQEKSVVETSVLLNANGENSQRVHEAATGILEQERIKEEEEAEAQLQKIREEFLQSEDESDEAWTTRIAEDSRRRRESALQAKEDQRVQDLKDAGILETRGVKDEKLEATIQTLEQELGIENPLDRLVEAGLLIDKKFLDTMLISGQNIPVERIFGDAAWADWLHGRQEARYYHGEQLTRDLIKAFHTSLRHYSNRELGGAVRTDGMLGGDYKDLGRPISYTVDQLLAIHQNPLLRFQQMGDTADSGLIMYPSEPGIFADSMNLTDEAKQILQREGNSVSGLLEAGLHDICAWYNTEKEKQEHDPHALAAQLQRKIVSLHAFKDVNGRLSRLLLNWSLENEGVAPCILSEPSDDILVSEQVWIDEVKTGSERYEATEKRKELVKDMGYEDEAFVMGLDDERTFYNYIYSHLHKPPDSGASEGILNHKEFDKFTKDFNKEFKIFNRLYSADSKVMLPNQTLPAKEQVTEDDKPPRLVLDEEKFWEDPDAYHKETVVHQGGLVSQLMIDVTKNGQVGHAPEVREALYSDIPLYRGGVVTGEISEEVALQMMLEPAAFMADYRSLDRAHVESTTTNSISGELLAESMEDYNRVVGNDYLRRRHGIIDSLKAGVFRQEQDAGKTLKQLIKPLLKGNYLRHLVGNHKFGADIEHSTFVSTSFSPDLSYMWSHRNRREDDGNTSVLIKTRMPKTGSLVGYKPTHEAIKNRRERGEEMSAEKYLSGFEQRGSSIPNLVGRGQQQSEVYLTGGINPNALDEIRIYAEADKRLQDIDPKGLKVYPQELPTFIVRRREGQENNVELIDYRNNPEGEKRVYTLDEHNKSYVLQASDTSML